MTILRVIAGLAALPFTAFALLVLRAQLQYGLDLLGVIFGSAVALLAIVCWWFALRGHRAESRASLGYALGGGFILGGVSFAAGFFGPLILTPEANQGPLLGIFLTGPIGFVIGGALGAVYARFRVRRPGQRIRWQAVTAGLLLAGCCVAVAGLVYLNVEPDDRRLGELVDGIMRTCTAPAQFADEVLKEWEKSIAINPQKAVSSSWREDVVRTLMGSDGYVATFGVQRKRDLYTGRKRSNYGSTYAAPWLEKEETVRYFVSRELCAMGADGKRSVYLADWPVWPSEDRFPPDDASRLFSRMKTLRPVPPSYAVWASQGN